MTRVLKPQGASKNPISGTRHRSDMQYIYKVPEPCTEHCTDYPDHLHAIRTDQVGYRDIRRCFNRDR